MRQKEAAEDAKREHELELARLAAMNGDGRAAERDDRAKTQKTSSVSGWYLEHLEAHGKDSVSPGSRKPSVQPESDEAKNTQINATAIQCFKGNTRSHIAVNCPTITKRCFLCGKQGHEARNCRLGERRSGGQSKDGNSVQRGEVSSSCLVQPPEIKPTAEEVKSCIKDDKLLLACDKKIPLLSSGFVKP